MGATAEVTLVGKNRIEGFLGLREKGGGEFEVERFDIGTSRLGNGVGLPSRNQILIPLRKLRLPGSDQLIERGVFILQSIQHPDFGGVGFRHFENLGGKLIGPLQFVAEENAGTEGIIFYPLIFHERLFHILDVIVTKRRGGICDVRSPATRWMPQAKGGVCLSEDLHRTKSLSIPEP